MDIQDSTYGLLLLLMEKCLFTTAQHVPVSTQSPTILGLALLVITISATQPQKRLHYMYSMLMILSGMEKDAVPQVTAVLSTIHRGLAHN